MFGIRTASSTFLYEQNTRRNQEFLGRKKRLSESHMLVPSETCYLTTQHAYQLMKMGIVFLSLTVTIIGSSLATAMG